MMFPYPSAEGLHVGNIYAFTGADVFGRFKRMQGHDVFEPIGFDAFGIHSENFALKTGVHPTELIPANVANFRRQLRRIGGMFDWEHTVDTTDPDYYKWTQWLFLQLFKHGLAEQKEAPVNWCPSCMTVLANEQVIVGACERCGCGVEQRFIRQWFFRITEYAEQAAAQPEAHRLVGPRRSRRSTELDRAVRGRRVAFHCRADGRWPGDRRLTNPAHRRTRGTSPAPETTRIIVFTTRPDTVFGATYVVLAPEHPLVDAVTSDESPGRVVDRLPCHGPARRTWWPARRSRSARPGSSPAANCINPASGELAFRSGSPTTC